MRSIYTLVVLVSSVLVSFGQGGLSSIVFTNLNLKYFDVDFTRFNTNIVQIKFNTNQFDVSGDTITILGLLSNVVINPTDGRVPVRASATNFVDSPIRVTATNEVAADIFNTYYLRVTNLIAGGVVVSIPDGDAGILTNAPPGDGFLYSPTGTNDFNWLPISDVCLWTNIGGSYYTSQSPDSIFTTNLYSDQRLTAIGGFAIEPQVTIDLDLGENDLNVYQKGYIPLSADTADPADTQIRLNYGNGPGSLILLQNVLEGSGFTLYNGDELWDSATEHLYLGGGDWTPTHNGQTLLLLGTARGYAEVGRFGGPTNVLTDSLWEYSGGYLTPQDRTQPIFITNAISFNSGHTTAFYSDGSNWFLTNNTSTPLLKVTDASGNTGAFGVESPGYTFIRADSGKVVALNVTGSPDLWYTGSALYPASGVIDIGSTSAHVFRHLYMNGTESIYGFINGTNTAWLDINHAGTNAVSGGVVYNSRGQGTAGSGGPHWFRVDSTNLFKVDYNVGASTTALLIYENGTAQRVTIGANDSGGGGFRVLRVPN